MKKSMIAVFVLFFSINISFGARDYVFSSASNDKIFSKFNDEVNSYDNALMVIVQTYDRFSGLQTVEDIKFSVFNNSTNAAEDEEVKTPYLKVIADYKEFKEKYDFSTSNAKRRMIEDNPDASYIVKIEANLKNEREIRVFVVEQKKIIASQTSGNFPFLFASAFKTKYSEAIENKDKSIDNSGLNNFKDYIGGPRIIKKGK
jgi:hypothetical protein